MKRFQCGNNQVFFENSRCMACERELGFIPEALEIVPLQPVDENYYKAADSRLEGLHFRKCVNYRDQQVCNWMIAAEDDNPFCVACRLNQTIPDLSYPQNRDYWREIEQAKRRLMFTLLSLQLPVVGRMEDPQYGLAFAFLADKSQLDASEFIDEATGGNPIMTGHNAGLITINIAEADPGYREQMRQQMNESYRTLLGHFRHEVGHYYWYRLIHHTEWLTEFRQLFGDETRDYNAAINYYYNHGPGDWQQYYISAYAAAHPWEDWAECWAHYMHIIDTLETAFSSRLLSRDSILGNLRLQHHEQSLLIAMQQLSIEDILGVWIDLSVAMNNINRSIGLGDFYPFVIRPNVMAKLSFIHRLITDQLQSAKSEQMVNL